MRREVGPIDVDDHRHAGLRCEPNERVRVIFTRKSDSAGRASPVETAPPVGPPTREFHPSRARPTVKDHVSPATSRERSIRKTVVSHVVAIAATPG
jgi:hypothetical protein